MTEAAQQSSSPAIDQSRKYKVDPGGPCERCGFYKTWEFRVLNPKSGKMMPGHVTQEGFKVGDGNCPFWGSIKKNKVDKPGSPPRAAPGVPDAGEFFKQGPASGTSVTSRLQGSGNGDGITMQRDGNRLVLAIGQASVAIEKIQAVKLARDLLDFIAV
jgi:hypothetical protein